jgi:hypothetical protein
MHTSCRKHSMTRLRAQRRRVVLTYQCLYKRTTCSRMPLCHFVCSLQFPDIGVRWEEAVVFDGRVHGALEADWRVMHDIARAPVTGSRVRDAPTGHNTCVPYSSTSILGRQLFFEHYNLSLAAGAHNHHVQFIATSLVLFACSIRDWSARCPQYPRYTCLPRALSRDRGEQDATRRRQQSSS